MSSVKRVHYFHAEATAAGGFVEAPFGQMQLLPVIAPLSLPVVGGHASARSETFCFDGVVSFKCAITHVAGTQNASGWNTLATATVEELNILDAITSDRVVARVAAKHPAAGYHPKVSFAGSRFENLRIFGNPVTPIPNDEIWREDPDPDRFPKQSAFADEGFLKATESHHRRISDSKGAPDWVRDRYAWDNSRLTERGAVVCSIFQGVEGKFPGTAHGPILDIPKVGRVFLGELIVDRNSHRLEMLRVELDGPVKGAIVICGPGYEGTTSP